MMYSSFFFLFIISLNVYLNVDFFWSPPEGAAPSAPLGLMALHS